MSDEPADRARPDDVVVTPGGPRPAERVRRVGPGEAVDADMVLTPGGSRPRTQVHRVGRDNRLDVRDGHCRQLDPSGREIIDHGVVSLQPGRGPRSPGAAHLPPTSMSAHIQPAPALGSGWIASARWENSDPVPISLFSTAWEVPIEPRTRSGQLIYLFNGLKYPLTDDTWPILQPVLQWGSNGLPGAGEYWMVASWMVFGSDMSFHSDLVRVDVGDRLVGLMTMTDNRGPGLLDYRCEFPNIEDTTLNIINSREFTWAFETLEAYGITKCSDYPLDPKTKFWAISLETSPAFSPDLSWTPLNQVTDCGQHVFVQSDSASCGEVDIHYRL